MNLDLKDAQEYPSKISRNAIGRDGIHTIVKMVMFKYNYYFSVACCLVNRHRHGQTAF